MTDDDLRQRLRRGDPAASLPPLPPEEQRTLSIRATAGPVRAVGPGGWRVLLAAAALVVVAGVGWLAAGGGRPAAPDAGGAPVPVRLQVPPVAAKCSAADAATLRRSADFAFAGRLESFSQTTATFAVGTVFRGATATQVAIEVDDRHSEVLLGAGTLVVGTDYLIAASGGSVLPCGYSGAADAPGLRQLYEAAF